MKIWDKYNEILSDLSYLSIVSKIKCLNNFFKILFFFWINPK